MSEEEKEAIESLKGKEISIELNWTPEQKATFEEVLGIKELEENCIKVDILIKLIDKLQKEIEKYKRLAKANLKDSQEFQDNMCNHRCIKNNEVLELKAELQKKDKVIDLMAYQLFRYGYYVVKKYDVESELYIKSKTKEEIKEYFYEKAEE